MKNRQAVIREVKIDNSVTDEKMYVVDLYERDKLVEVRSLPGKSIHFANDVAENWENGIIRSAS